MVSWHLDYLLRFVSVIAHTPTQSFSDHLDSMPMGEPIKETYTRRIILVSKWLITTTVSGKNLEPSLVGKLEDHPMIVSG